MSCRGGPSENDMNSGRCPEDSVLDDYDQAALDPATTRVVRRHVEHCDRCRSLLTILTEGAEMAELLREARRESSAESRERLIRAAHGLAKTRR